MLRFLEAGFIAGARQLLAVILITSAVFLTVSERVALESVSVLVGEPELWPSVPVLLTWTYLLTAIGLALTENHHVDLTAKRMRRATHLLGDEHPPSALASQLTIAAVLFCLLGAASAAPAADRSVPIRGISCSSCSLGRRNDNGCSFFRCKLCDRSDWIPKGPKSSRPRPR
jgi:hypothetical protein